MRCALLYPCFVAACAIAAITPESAPNAGTVFHRSGRAFLPEQGCSLVVRQGWHKQQDANSTVLLARADNGSEANIIITVWKTPRSIQEFAAEAAAVMKTKEFKVGAAEPFTTFAKLEGVRMRAGAPDGRRTGIQYLFPAGEGRVLTLTGTFDHQANADFEQVMTLCMKTLHLLDRPHNLPAELGTRFGDKRATLRVPLGWEARADVAATTAFGPPVIHHGEQLFLNLEINAAPLREYVRAEIGAEGPKGLKFEDPLEFATPEAGLGFKVPGQLRTDDGQEQRTVTYYFDGPNGLKVIIGAAANADQWPAIQNLFDACVKTLQIGK
jgi:hypothetical protein